MICYIRLSFKLLISIFLLSYIIEALFKGFYLKIKAPKNINELVIIACIRKLSVIVKKQGIKKDKIEAKMQFSVIIKKT